MNKWGQVKMRQDVCVQALATGSLWFDWNIN